MYIKVLPVTVSTCTCSSTTEFTDNNKEGKLVLCLKFTCVLIS